MLTVFLIALACLIADQVTKFIMMGFFLNPASPLAEGILHFGDSTPVIKDTLSFTYVLNKGAAFGILENQRWFFLLVTVIICAVGIILLLRIEKKHPLLIISSGLILGGAVGNMIDRVVIGQVRDFIEADIVRTVTGYSFPVFNVADICVVVGVILLAVYILFLHEKTVKKDENNG